MSEGDKREAIEMAESDGEQRACYKCGKIGDDRNPLIEVSIDLTGEYWNLCDPCIDKMVDWLNTGGERDV